MRTLSFNVEGQRLRKDADCDFNGLMAGTKNYLRLSFFFDYEWNDCTKHVIFFEGDDRWHVHLENNKCMVPDDIAAKEVIRLYLIGNKVDTDYLILTNPINIRQNRSIAVTGGENIE